MSRLDLVALYTDAVRDLGGVGYLEFVLLPLIDTEGVDEYLGVFAPVYLLKDSLLVLLSGSGC